MTDFRELDNGRHVLGFPERTKSLVDEIIINGIDVRVPESRLIDAAVIQLTIALAARDTDETIPSVSDRLQRVRDMGEPLFTDQEERYFAAAQTTIHLLAQGISDMVSWRNMVGPQAARRGRR